MEISDKLLCSFNANIHTKDDRYVVEIPCREVEAGVVKPGETYRVMSIFRESNKSTESGPSAGPTLTNEPRPPAEVSELRYVKIEGIGKQDDSIAHVERGYVTIVPGTGVGERVKVEIIEIKSNFVVGGAVEDNF